MQTEERQLFIGENVVVVKGYAAKVGKLLIDGQQYEYSRDTLEQLRSEGALTYSSDFDEYFLNILHDYTHDQVRRLVSLREVFE